MFEFDYPGSLCISDTIGVTLEAIEMEIKPFLKGVTHILTVTGIFVLFALVVTNSVEVEQMAFDSHQLCIVE